MALKKYFCTHCEKRFESEEREIVECPACFWSTSVKPDTGAASKQSSAAKPDKLSLKPSGGGLPKPYVNFGAVLKPVFFFLAASILLFFCWKLLKPVAHSLTERADKRKEMRAPQDIKGPADAPAQPPAAPALSLSAEEEQVLAHVITVGDSAEPSPEQVEIFSREAPFQTGTVQKLPSQAWTLETFSKMLAEQQQFYKITFPRSYQGKIMDLFKSQYLPGSDAFLAGDLLKARDAWVNSLAIPMYSQDPMRHRAVALTMLRPFINDTLSKIGALNTMLIESQLRSREEEINQDYLNFRSQLQKKSWAEAWESAGKVQDKIAGFEQSVKPDSAAPNYPESIRQIDRDIGATLLDILTPPTPPLGNLVPILEDVKAKKAALEALLPEKVGEQKQIYDQAQEQIRQRNWSEAEALLQKIRFPKVLSDDARAKLAVIRKLKNQSLDSVPKSS